MEAVDENLTELPAADVVKTTTLENVDTAVAVAADLCQNSNGVVEIGKAGQLEATTGGNEVGVTPETELVEEPSSIPGTASVEIEVNESESPNIDISAHDNKNTNISVASPDDTQNQDVAMLDVNEVVTEVVIDDEIEKTVSHEVDIIEVNVLKESSNDTPKFNTEILIEANDANDSTGDSSESPMKETDEQDTPNNILSEFGESIELSEVLRSSDVTVPLENNNGLVRQEVFNKEELLDILEGNDVEAPASIPVTEEKEVSKSPSIEVEVEHTPSHASETKKVLKSTSKEIEAKLALQQLSRLKSEKRRYRGALRIVKEQKDKRSNTLRGKHVMTEGTPQKKKINKAVESKTVDNENDINIKSETNTAQKIPSKESVPAENIVNVLVMDWDDEEQEPNESDQSKEVLIENESLLNESEKLKDNQDNVNKEKPILRSSIDSVSNEDHTQKDEKRSGDENQPQRRQARVIKKKVIFDPDNPDTFTKTKTKSKELVHAAKEQPPLKKLKHEQSPQRSKSNSPMTNLQWKKPSSKNSKQNRRLTEVDKLLMDEGAVNMIYQLTPEAPKGKKSRETKAEFIKKIQSSTPDGKEMKFRERKKETLKYEDGETKKIVGGKHKGSLNNSMKSPSASEDFETHSADDSIIYRRHSSSSYSSSCMSPRRLSDVELSAQANVQPSSETQTQVPPNVDNPDQVTDVFLGDVETKTTSEIINKDDYLSIKEKLNSKLSLALNKRKRESTKNDRLPKQKKVMKNVDKIEGVPKSSEDFKYVTIKIHERLAEISVENTGSQYGIEVLKEVEEALGFVNSIKEISVTLLTSKCGTLCSNLDLSGVIEEDKIKRDSNALEVAETIRSVQLAVDKHSKLVCSGVRAACRGVGLALAALSDVVLAAEEASFAVAARHAPPRPAAAALTGRCRLPHAVVNDLILFGRQLSASEALQGGLVSRVLWPDKFAEQVHNIAMNIASEPAQNVMLKKQLINLKKIGENEQTFLSCLNTERDVFVEYWTSVEGQELLRTADA